MRCLAFSEIRVLLILPCTERKSNKSSPLTCRCIFLLLFIYPSFTNSSSSKVICASFFFSHKIYIVGTINGACFLKQICLLTCSSPSPPEWETSAIWCFVNQIYQRQLVPKRSWLRGAWTSSKNTRWLRVLLPSPSGTKRWRGGKKEHQDQVELDTNKPRDADPGHAAGHKKEAKYENVFILLATRMCSGTENALSL